MTVQFDTLKTSGQIDVEVSRKPESFETSSYRRIWKRALDIALVVVASPILLPLTIILAFLIRLNGHNPFYVQRRVGRNGKVFRMWKFQTMVPNAELVLRQYVEANPKARAEWNAHQKLKNDPRITMIGRFLRKTSMDELPQFWNVLIGNMSLVGPRPMMVDQKSLYPGTSYYRMRPGITGLWQISDRNNCEFKDRAKFDEDYERVISLRSDISIMARTLGVVLRGTGY